MQLKLFPTYQQFCKISFQECGIAILQPKPALRVVRAGLPIDGFRLNAEIKAYI